MSPVERERCFSNSSWKGPGNDCNWTDMPTPEPITGDLGNEMSWLARPGSGAYLWGQRWGQHLPAPTDSERGKKYSVEKNQEAELGKRGVGCDPGPSQSLQWVIPNCWSRPISPHAEIRRLHLKNPLLPSLGREKERESQLDFPFPNHLVFLINLLPAPPREHLSRFFFSPSEGSWKKSEYICMLPKTF